MLQKETNLAAIKIIEVDEENLPYEEIDWEDTEQREVPKNTEPDLPFTFQIR